MIELMQRLTRRQTVAVTGGLAAGALLLLVSYLTAHPGARSLPELPTDDVAARKAAFFDFLRPVIHHHNEKILEDRAWLESLDASEPPGWWDRQKLYALAEDYRVDADELGYAETLTVLERRVDVIPESLVLVQAAKESGWGRSRFAREGNALFGEWCFTEGCGIVPGQRGAGKMHEVRSFDSVHDAVGSYLSNLNSHRPYKDMRLARQAIRDNGKPLSGSRLAEKLTKYSERGQDYVREVQSMIRQNGLEGD